MIGRDSAVILMLSAELVDSEKRSLQRRDVGGNLLSDFVRLTSKFGVEHSKVWILAEPFKRVASIYEESWDFDFHLPRIQITHPPSEQPELVSVV